MSETGFSIVPSSDMKKFLFDTLPLKEGTRGDAKRAYIHKQLDCWLDNFLLDGDFMENLRSRL